MNVTLSPPPRLLMLGDSAATIEFGDAIDPRINARVIGFARRLEQACDAGELDGVVEWVPTFRSLTVYFADPADHPATDPDALSARLLALAGEAAPATTSGRHWSLPVCFAPEFAPDLAALAAAKRLAVSEVVTQLTSTPFRVYMLGFLPGFPYLGGLPAALDVPRLATPRKAVPERSLAIAGGMCAVYPWPSPGGWHLLGRTPVRLFDAGAADSPALLRAGDTIRWSAIDADTYGELDALAAAGRLPRAQWLAATDGGTR